MELIEKQNEKIRFTSEMNISLANAIRRSVNEIPTLAIVECDFYKNDSALYDEVIAHRMGLIPLKNQKLKEGQTVNLKLKAKGKEGGVEVLAGELGDLIVYPDLPLVLIDENQQFEVVARAGVGKGVEHSKFSPGMMYYYHLAQIKITKEGESQTQLAELYPEVFSFDTKLKVKDASKCHLDLEDTKEYPGVEISFNNALVFQIESWGQMSAKDIFVEACKALKGNLSELSKALK